MKKLILILPLLISNILCFSQLQFEEMPDLDSYNMIAQQSVDVNNDSLNDILVIIQNVDPPDYTYSIGWIKNIGGKFSQVKIVDFLNYQFSSMYGADMDNDGDIDIVCTTYEYQNSKIIWYENLGNETFSSGQYIYNFFGSSIAFFNINCADMDNDGDNDILLIQINESSGYIQIIEYINAGGGVFNYNAVNSIGSFDFKRTYTADVNSDGLLDVVADAYQGSTFPWTQSIIWYQNLGGNSFDTPDTIYIDTLSGNAQDPTFSYAVDVDLDGDLDFLFKNELDESGWIENNAGVYSLNILTAGITSTNKIPFDYNNDGLLDILSYNNGSISGWHENLGGGNFSAFANAYYPDDIVIIEDLNNDNQADLIHQGFQSSIYWNSPLPVIGIDTSQIISHSFQAFSDIEIIDFNNDNYLDVIASASGSSNSIVLYSNIGGNSFDMGKILSNTFASDIVVLDIDIDGDLDIICVCGSNLSWLENTGNNNYAPVQFLLNIGSQNGFDILMEDVDNDGDMDIIGGRTFFPSSVVFWLENLGAGSFNSEQIISTDMTGSSGWRASTSDIDNDGDMDLFVASRTVKNIVWYENLGSGNFNTGIAIDTVSDEIYSLQTEDINGDGNIDIVVGMGPSFSKSIVWYENLGLGVFGPQQLINSSSASSLYDIHISDMDSDGDMDIISAQNITNNSLKYFENLGSGIFNPAISIPYSFDYSSKIKVGDIDNDGDKDFITIAIDGSSGDEKLIWFKSNRYSTNQIGGSVYYDINQNGIIDSSEFGLSNISIMASPSSNSVYTLNDGKYFKNFSDSQGNYQIFPQTLQYWSITSDSLVYNINIDSTFSSRDSLDFGFYPDTIVNDINAEIIGSFPRCNDTLNYWLDVKNNGTTIPSGVIHLQLHDSISYIGSINTPDSINGQNIYWNYDSLFYFSNEQINLQVLMPDFNSVGSALISYLMISILDSAGNQLLLVSDTLNEGLLCAYDPNDKIADPIGIDSLGYINANTQFIEYTVRFQNTGNDTANTVNIIDQLDTNLVWNTLTPLASSHTLQLDVDQNGEVTFKFENILLPDSGADFLGSQGFVKYKINLKTGLALGTSILNTANIYFDQNPAVITNTKINTIYDCNGFVQNTLSSLSICENDSIFGNAVDDLSVTSFSWSIPNVYNSTGANFNWLPDTSGTFNLTLSTSNILCNKDTTVLLTISPAFSTNQNNSICQGDSLLIYGSYESTTDIYYDSLQTILGCDSIFSTTLTVNPAFFSNKIDSICQGDSLLIYGVFQNIAGVYDDSLQTILGCDSILSTTLTVNPLPNVTITNFNPDTVCSTGGTIILPNGTPTGGNYTGSGVGGGNFDPAAAGIGTHDVIYTFTDSNSCINSDTTIINVMLCTAIDESTTDFGIIIYPNPNTGLFTVEKPSDLNKQVIIKLLDVSSKLILEKVIQAGQQKIDMDITNYSKGIYYLQLIVEGEVFVKQILKD
jgi:uncharacterized repeat protein (TIGR01451 family)